MLRYMEKKEEDSVKDIKKIEIQMGKKQRYKWVRKRLAEKGGEWMN